MSGTIASLLSNGFSQLASSTASTDKTKASTSTPTLAEALGENTKSSDAFVLSLSDQARAQLLAARQKLASQTKQSDSFTLNSYQQQSLDTIIAKYADQPLTEENYTALQNELYNSGLAPEQLSMMSKVSSFNSTQALMDAMNGVQSDPNDFMANIGQVDQKKTENFLNDVVSRWQAAYAAANPETGQETGNAATDETATTGQSTVSDTGKTNA